MRYFVSSFDSKRLSIILIRRSKRCTGFGFSCPSRLVNVYELSMAFIHGDFNLKFCIVDYPVDTPTYQSFIKVHSLCIFTVVLFELTRNNML